MLRLPERRRSWVLGLFGCALLGCGGGASTAEKDAGGSADIAADRGPDLNDSSDVPAQDMASGDASSNDDAAPASDDAGTDASGGEVPGNSLNACGAGVSLPPFKGPPAEQTDSDQMFRSLTVDPTNPDIVYVGSEGNGMFRTTDAGVTWTWLRSGLRRDSYAAYAETWDMAVAPSNPMVLYAAMTDSPGPVSGDVPSARAGVYRSDDRGDSWRQVGCDLPNSKAASLHVDPQNADVVFVSIEGGAPSFTEATAAYYPGGLFKSTDGGAHFTAVTLPAMGERSPFWWIASRAGKLWAFSIPERDTPQSGLGFLTSDNGSVWTSLPTTFAGKLVAGWDVSADGQTILAAVRDSFKMMRSNNGGTSFAEVTTLPFAPQGPIAISPVNPQFVLYAGNERLFRSVDGASDSVEVLTAIGNIEEIVYAPSNPQIVYVGTRKLGVYRSTNGGAQFVQVGSLRTAVIDAN